MKLLRWGLNSHINLFAANLYGAAMKAKQIPGLSSVTQDVCVESVARYFGGTGYIGNKKTDDRIRNAIAKASSLIRPKGTYTLFGVLDYIPGKEVILENGIGLSIPECFTDKGIQFVAAAIGTLGNKLENQTRILADQGKIYESTLLDCVGIAMLDLMGEKICKTIELESYSLGLAKRFRFAPGLEGYPLEQQQQLFLLADNEAVGVLLNSSAIMMPAKSISFFLMLTKTGKKTKEKNKCSSCRMAGCKFRIINKKD